MIVKIIPKIGVNKILHLHDYWYCARIVQKPVDIGGGGGGGSDKNNESNQFKITKCYLG